MFNSENAQKKWAPLLEHSDCAPIKDPYRKAVTATLLENQEKRYRKELPKASNWGPSSDSAWRESGWHLAWQQ